MTDAQDSQRPEFVRADLTGARFERVQLNGAQFRMVDFSKADFRAVSLAGASIEGELWEFEGLRINGIPVVPLLEAELVRRQPARALISSSDSADLRRAWELLEQGWEATYRRVADMPPGTADVSVMGEWSFAQTLRHLVFATDAWLGAIERDPTPFHPWGLPFSDYEDFAGPAADVGVDLAATPSYTEILDVRRARVGRVRDFLARVSPGELETQVAGPIWENGQPLSVLRCLRVILNEECDHHRYAERDLDLIETGGAVAVD